MGARWVPILLVFLSSAAVGREDADVEAALSLDDQCTGAEDEEACSLSAMQLRGNLIQEEGKAGAGGPIWHYALPCWDACGGAGDCPNYCGPGNACCKQGVDNAPECRNVGFFPVVGYHTCVKRPAESLPTYGKVWSAEGKSFFDAWNFEWQDFNHGAAEYLPSAEQAKEAGVIQEYDNHIIFRAGEASKKYQYKRQSAKVTTKESWKYFLMTMKFSHIPYGCGVWPALFTLAPGAEWPKGGEVDILEYVNDGNSQSSFHTGENCKLDHKAADLYGFQKDYNRQDYNCYTNYPEHLGCAPNKWTKSGKAWAESPGVVAVEWTEDFLKLFYIPEGSIPSDLDSDAPRPAEWDKWLFSYYPFKASGCSKDVMQAQQLVMQIAFCGDWASKVWGQSAQCKWMAKGSCRSVDPLAEYAPAEDCCTQYIYDEGGVHGTDAYLKERAFFNISYIKVYQQQAKPETTPAPDLAPAPAPDQSPDALHWWYVDNYGKEQGPFPNSVMKVWASEGYFQADQQLRHTPTGDFAPLGTLFPTAAPFSVYPKE